MNLAAFVLYGLAGCGHCAQAEEYLKKAGVPFTVVIANGDPIADEGVKYWVKKADPAKEQSEYPILVYRITNNIVLGFQQEKYEELTKHFYTSLSASTPSAFGGQQPSVNQAPEPPQAPGPVAAAA